MTNSIPGVPDHVPLTVKGIKKLSRGRMQIKVSEKEASFQSIILNGKQHPVIKSLGRGRFILGSAS